MSSFYHTVRKLWIIAAMMLIPGCLDSTPESLDGVEISILAETFIEGDSIQFMAAGNNPSGAKFLWDFGDSQGSSGRSVKHVYSDEGTYTVTLTVIDDGSTASTKGQANCTITEGDLLTLDSGFYNFAVREVKSDGSREVTYADTGYAAAGTIELLDGAYPDFVASTSITGFTATADIKSLARVSGTIDARPGINNNKALHTIAVYSKDLTGSLKVQGTMASSPTSAVYFFDITMETLIISYLEIDFGSLIKKMKRK